MIPLPLQRARALFAEPLPLETFDEVVDRNPHYWRDAEAVRDAALAAHRKWVLTAEVQTFVVRVRRADDDAGLEFLSLVFEVEPNPGANPR